MSNPQDFKRINELIARRFGNIEQRVAAAETIAGLFEALLDGIEAEFSVPFVWLSLIDDERTAPLREALVSSEALKHRFSVVPRDLLEGLLSDGLRPVLANQNLQLFYRLFPPSRKYFVRSIAVAPFALDGRLIGAWNNGDADVHRYEADMNTDLLAHLAAQVSSGLDRLVAQQNTAADGGPSGG
ncbi:MAG: GAF domain-containing protein [Smithellaceae bacterium]|nr:GAF domain-containing protein [Syntrophaceae bacterium]MDD4242485.1 GAF domain-containing protein [Smithellaceae bacterium]NLX53097.1 GAF domain-containing protein [Deltaproteobacteria bacterium]